MSDLVQRVVKAVAQAISHENPYDLPADLPGFAPSELGLAEVAVVAALRELAKDLDGKPPREMVPVQVTRAALRSLADEIATHTDQETPR